MSQSVYDLLLSAAKGRTGVDRQFIRGIVAQGEAAVDDLVKFGLEDRSHDPVGLELDIVNMLRIIGSPKALPYYIELVRQQPFEVEDELMEAFIETGAPAMEPLLALYEELGEEEGGEVAFLLASLGIHDDRVRKVLVERLEYDAWDAAVSLGLYADPTTAADIQRVLADIPDDEENRLLRADLGRAIEDVQRERSETPKKSADEIIDEYPEKALPQFDALTERERLELLADEDPEVRAECAQSFSNEELSEKVKAKLFSLAQHDAEDRVRAAAWRALGTVVAEDDAIARVMRARAKDAGVPAVERGGALIGLASLLGDPELRKLADTFYNDLETRAMALEAMRRSLDRDFALYFPKHLNDADPEIKREAIWGVGYLGVTSEAENLRAFFEDEDYRADALFAYALSVRHETSRGRMRALLRKIEEAAGGFSEPEEQMVKFALDERLALKGMEPVFANEEHDHDHSPDNVKPMPPVTSVEVGRNDPCPCGSGKKYKKCCGA